MTGEDVALVFLDDGGAVSEGGVELLRASYTDAEVFDARLAIATAVGDHMGTYAGMTLGIYDPTNDALPVGRCTSCHMPKVAKSGGWTTGLDFNGESAMVEGDQTSHVFDIVWPAASAALVPSANGVDTNIMPNSCGQCHESSRISAN